MKRFTVILMILAFSSSVPITAFASDASTAQVDILYIDKEPQAVTSISDDVPVSSDSPVENDTYMEEPEGNGTLYPADGQYSNISELYEYWEQNGYPDYVGGVFSTDGGMNNLTVLIVNGEESKAEQIRNLLVDDSGVSFGTAMFSYNEMKAANDEIVANYLGSDNKVYSVGIGWISKDGVATGFGESGKESRVVVSVDKSVLTEYEDKFYKLYGDMVVVEEGGAAILENAENIKNISSPSNVWQLPLVISLTIIIVAGILFFNRTRFIPAMQTTKGAVVTQSAPASRKQVIDAIKNGEAVPKDEVFNTILCKIGKDDG